MAYHSVLNVLNLVAVARNFYRNLEMFAQAAYYSLLDLAMFVPVLIYFRQ